MSDKLKLDIGCGPTPKEGFIGVDRYIQEEGVKKWDMGEILYPGFSVAEIYSSHTLEHIGKDRIPYVLKEWYRVLKMEGILHVEVPDLVWCVENWLEYLSNDWHMDTIFGNQKHIGEYHKTGFTMDLLKEYVLAAGFTITESYEIESHDQNTLVVIGIKR